MIERGIASINERGGFIDAEQDPTPVSFLPASFSLVNDGDTVHFERSSSDPEWAVSVAPESRVAALESSLGPVRLTSGAIKRLTETTVQLVVEAQAAPTVAQTENHLQLTGEKLKVILETEALGVGKLDARTIDKALKKI